MVDRGRASKDIKNAWVAAVASAALMLVVVLVSSIGGLPFHGADWGAVLEIVVLMALAFGVRLKSRTAAVALLAYFVVIQVLLRAGLGMGATGLFVAVVLGWFYGRGVIGTFADHRLDTAVVEADQPIEAELAAS